MPEPKRPLKVFLCHASTDKPKVRELYRYLKRRGINPWFDEEHLVGGQDWQVEIPKAIATSDAIIICLTKNSVDKEGYIQKEIKFALDKALEMPEGRIFLIPVKFEECEVPFTLSRYQWVDLTIESGYTKMMKALKFRASQLERSTVELPKTIVVEENLTREKIERESVDRIERERIAKEAREKQERETAEKDAREKLQREIDKRAKDIQRKLKQEIFFSRLRSKLSLFFLYFRYYVLPAILLLGMAAGGYYLGKPFFDKSMSPTQGLAVAQTSTLQSNVTKTVFPSETIAPIFAPTENVTQTPIPLPTEITDTSGVSMILVSAGEFLMGSNDYNQDEKPLHTVSLSAFYIDKYETTISLYKDCVNAGVCKYEKDCGGAICGDYSDNQKNYPLNAVEWDQAKVFCEWRGARLPTEAEWEKAARGTDGRTYPWGEEINFGVANINNVIGDVTEVGSYPLDISPYGVYDMAGNVREWVMDWYDENYYAISPLINPLGPQSGGGHVLRGGAFDSWGVRSRASCRDSCGQETYIFGTVGFRCAKGATP